MAFMDKPDYSIDVAMVYAQHGAGSSSGAILVPPLSTSILINLSGAGRILYIILYCRFRDMSFRFYIDGVLLWWPLGEYLNPLDWVTYLSAVNYGIGIRLTKYDEPEGRYCFVINIPYEFKTSFVITVYNGDNINIREARGSVHYLDLGRTA